jgi:hypothetical protein
MTYQLRHRVTQTGFRAALFFSRTYNRVLRPGLAAVLPGHSTLPTSPTRAVAHLEAHITAAIAERALAT